METAINLLSSSSSFPPRAHFRTNIATSSSSSSVPAFNEQISFSAPTPSTSSLRQFPTCQLSPTSDRKNIGNATLVQQHRDSILQTQGDYDLQLNDWSSLSFLLRSLEKDENLSAIATEQLTDWKSSDAISLAEEALAASKFAMSLAESYNALDEDESHTSRLNNSPKVIPTVVRSSRLIERRAKKRRSSKPSMDHEIVSSRKIESKRLNERYDPNDPLRLFLCGPETKQLLTIQEENELIGQIQDFNRLVAVKGELQSQFDREPTFAEWGHAVGLNSVTLRSKILSWKRSREKLITANFRMVVYIAKQYQGRGLNLQDLLQEGSMGLMKSVEKFKPQAGCRFPSYAYWWIRQAIRKAIFQHSRTIRLPENMYNLHAKVLEAKKSFIQEGNHNATTEDLALRTGITVEKLQNLLSLMRYPVSMQQSVWADQSTTFQEVTADTNIENPNVCAEKQLMRKHLRNILHTLAPREHEIIKLRFGIGHGTGKQHSLSEIGTMFDLSKERVRQIESRALHKLKESLNSHGLKAYTDLLL